MNMSSFIKIPAPIALLACSALLMGCTVRIPNVNVNNANTIVGSGKAVTEERSISNVNAVSLLGSGRMEVAFGERETLSITADDNLLAYLTSEVSNGRLTLGTKPFTSYTTRTPVVYKLTLKRMNALDIIGSGDATVNGLKAEKWVANIPGSGSISVDGAANDQHLTIAGSGSYKADNLNSKSADINILGSGSASVNVSDSLNVNIGGSGDVTYSGNPAKVTKQILGSGTVRESASGK
jgi:hypothetical protein